MFPTLSVGSLLNAAPLAEFAEGMAGAAHAAPLASAELAVGRAAGPCLVGESGLLVQTSSGNYLDPKHGLAPISVATHNLVPGFDAHPALGHALLGGPKSHVQNIDLADVALGVSGATALAAGLLAVAPNLRNNVLARVPGTPQHARYEKEVDRRVNAVLAWFSNKEALYALVITGVDDFYSLPSLPAFIEWAAQKYPAAPEAWTQLSTEDQTSADLLATMLDPKDRVEWTQEKQDAALERRDRAKADLDIPLGRLLWATTVVDSAKEWVSYAKGQGASPAVQLQQETHKGAAYRARDAMQAALNHVADEYLKARDDYLRVMLSHPDVVKYRAAKLAAETPPAQVQHWVNHPALQLSNMTPQEREDFAKQFTRDVTLPYEQAMSKYWDAWCALPGFAGEGSKGHVHDDILTAMIDLQRAERREPSSRQAHLNELRKAVQRHTPPNEVLVDG